MGWSGEMRDNIADAKKAIDKYPKNSLGWLLAAELFNDTAWEVSGQGDDISWFGVDRDEDNEVKTIDIPRFDMDQILIIKGEQDG